MTQKASPLSFMKFVPDLLRRTGRKRGAPVNTPPGTLSYNGPEQTKPAVVDVIRYNEKRYDSWRADDMSTLGNIAQASEISWINVNGLHDIRVIQSVGEVFAIHPIILEKVPHLGQRPKYEAMGDYAYMVFDMITMTDDGQLRSEQISLIFGQGYLLSFQEKTGDVFGALRDRIAGGLGRIRSRGPDYLAYSILDAVVDHYFVVLDRLEKDMEILEEAVFNGQTEGTAYHLSRTKNRLVALRRSVWPLRQMMSSIQQGDSDWFAKEMGPFLRDLADHVYRVTDTLDSMREILSSILDIHLNNINKRTNDVMRVLTIIATIFIPLTFLAGVYGMNFKYMPELEWKYAYFSLLALMGLIILLMIWFFKRKHWL